MTDKELVETLILKAFQQEDEDYSNVDEIDGWKLEDIFDSKYIVHTEDKEYTIVIEDQYGGEGMGDEYWIIFSIQEEDKSKIYFRKSGYYDSWNGTEWLEGIDIVNPVKETITVWK